jgi:hypothetical protein
MFRTFPRGCCGITCYLLARYLHEQAGQETNYVCGQRGRQSHAWLVAGRLAIDITGDQFDHRQPPVAVVCADRFHAFAINAIPHRADWRRLATAVRAWAEPFYQAILRAI